MKGCASEQDSACRYVRKHVAKTVRLRFVPDIRFFLDDSLEQDEEVCCPVAFPVSHGP